MKKKDEEAKSSFAGLPDASEEAFRKKEEDIEDLEHDEDVMHFEYNDDGEEDFKKTLKKLRAYLKQAKKEKEEYLTGWQKERAQFANYKKGEEDRRLVFSESVQERILGRFLSVLDSFNLAFSDKKSWEKIDQNWRKGMESIYSQINNIFEEYGVVPIGKEGDEFDPNVHEPMEMISTDKKKDDHKVAKIIQQGYKLGNRVIRPARINLFEYKE